MTRAGLGKRGITTWSKASNRILNSRSISVRIPKTLYDLFEKKYLYHRFSRAEAIVLALTEWVKKE